MFITKLDCGLGENTMRIGIDFDICTIRSDIFWLRWLNEAAQNNFTLEQLVEDWGYGEVPYDLSALFNMPKGLRALDFWKCRYLYDTMHPRPEAKAVLDQWAKEGHELIFISSVKGDHSKSKYLNIMRNFPHTSGVIFTKEKHYVDVDVMIDDRVDILEKFNGNVTTVQIPTPYKQFSNYTPDIVMNWEMLPLIMTEI
jgi:5'(3')-deoxyribonucleotidase